MSERAPVQRVRPYVTPEGDLERELTALWEEILGVGPIGAEDDFLELGGDSLRAHQLVRRVAATWAIDISLRSFVEAATVRDMAQVITRRRAAKG